MASNRVGLAFAAITGLVVVAYFLLRQATQSDSTDTTGGPSDMKLSAAQIAQYAQGAGFSGDDLVVATAVALAESSGNTGVVGDLALTPGGSVGLWQINLRWHPEYTAEELTDPATNAAAAFKIYTAAGNSFTPWSTYKNGAYGNHLNEASDAVAV